jgi:hypothetical protein
MKSAICQMSRHVRAHSANTNETNVHIRIFGRATLCGAIALFQQQWLHRVSP